MVLILVMVRGISMVVLCGSGGGSRSDMGINYQTINYCILISPLGGSPKHNLKSSAWPLPLRQTVEPTVTHQSFLVLDGFWEFLGDF